jgi:hypothetical protein
MGVWTGPRSLTPVSDARCLCRRYMLGVEIAGQMGDLPKDINEPNGEQVKNGINVTLSSGPHAHDRRCQEWGPHSCSQSHAVPHPAG